MKIQRKKAGIWSDGRAAYLLRSTGIGRFHEKLILNSRFAYSTRHWDLDDMAQPLKQTVDLRSHGADGIACWFIDTDYNEKSFCVRHAYFLGASDPYKSLKTTLKADINADAWESLHSDASQAFGKPSYGRIAVKVINHLGDEVMKVF